MFYAHNDVMNTQSSFCTGPQHSIDTSYESDRETTPLLGSYQRSHSSHAAEDNLDVAPTKQPSPGCCILFLNNFVTVAKGWKTYWAQSIFWAGLALSTTYMTVLGFDNITSGGSYVISLFIFLWYL